MSDEKWYMDSPEEAAAAGMTLASELVKLLQEAIEKHGDMPVGIADGLADYYIMYPTIRGAEYFGYDREANICGYNSWAGTSFTGKGMDRPYLGRVFCIGEL